MSLHLGCIHALTTGLAFKRNKGKVLLLLKQ